MLFKIGLVSTTLWIIYTTLWNIITGSPQLVGTVGTEHAAGPRNVCGAH